MSGITAIAAGDDHTLALKNDGVAWAWGADWYGQLGSGDIRYGNVGVGVPPAPVSVLTGVSAIAAGSSHSLALKNDGTVWAWGANWFGKVGITNPRGTSVPTQMSNLSEIIAIAAGADHNVALKADGSVRSWGSNRRGQLGNGSYSDSRVPVTSSLAGVKVLSASGEHTLALCGREETAPPATSGATAPSDQTGKL